MAPISRPTSFIDWDLNQANIAAPANAQVSNGHALNDILQSAETNYLWNRGGLWQRYFDSWLQEQQALTWLARTSQTQQQLGSNSGTAYSTCQFAYGSGVYVVAGAGGVISSSVDTANWTARTSNAGGQNINAVLYANAIFVAVAGNATIVTSPDGITWTARTSNAGVSNLATVAFGNSIFVAAGSGGTIVTSPDGITWTARTSNTANGIVQVIYANSLFVAITTGGAIVTSPDGITWTARTSNAGGNNLYGVTYANSLFVATGASGTIVTSPDGITWTARTSNAGGNSLNGVVATTVTSTFNATSTLFVAFGASGTIVTSPDGITWTARTSNAGSNTLYSGASWNGGVVVGGASGSLVTSLDGITWAQRSSGFVSRNNFSGTYVTGDILCVQTLNSGFLACGTAGQLSVSFASLPSTTKLVGTQTNDLALSGDVGEYVISSLVLGSGITMTTNVAANVVSISLPPGDWDVSAVIWLDGSLTGTVFDGGISTTSATLQTAPTARSQSPTVSTAAAEAAIVIKPSRISLSATTTVYLVARIVFSAGTAKTYGELTARRVR